MTVLYETTPAAVPVAINLLTNNSNCIDFRIAALKRALVRSDLATLGDSTLDFLANNFRSGGMDLIAQIIGKCPSLAPRFLSRGIVDRAREFALVSIDHGVLSLRFLIILLAVGPDQGEIARVAFAVLVRWGQARKRGTDICVHAAHLFRSISAEISREAFAAMDGAGRRACLGAMRDFTVSRPAKKIRLRSFSTTSPRRRAGPDVGEWQDMEIGD
jgi:hypothetical protein